MKENDRINLFIQYLKIIGKVESQEDVGRSLGYPNKSSFSQILKREITDLFKDKFEKTYPEYRNFTIGISDISEEKKHSKIELSQDQKIDLLMKENEEIKEQNEKIIENQRGTILYLESYLEEIASHFHIKMDQEKEKVITGIKEEFN